ncbi:MAG: hypothetical protein WDM76_09765 [Limisphaerales bacterium]
MINAGVSTNALLGACLIGYNGLVDTNFNLGPAPGNIVRVVVDSGTNIFVLGFWSSWNFVSDASGFAKLNPDGSRDNTFTPHQFVQQPLPKTHCARAAASGRLQCPVDCHQS